MNISFGKYEGKPVAILLKKPEYIVGKYKDELANTPEVEFLFSLMDTLESKPFSEVNCISCKGKNEGTQLSLYKGHYNGGYWFCGICDPYSKGAICGSLHVVSDYNELLFLDLKSRDKKELIKIFLDAKGVPSKRDKLKSYFGY